MRLPNDQRSPTVDAMLSPARDIVDVAGLTCEQFIEAARRRTVNISRAVAMYRTALRTGATSASWMRVGHSPITSTHREGPTTKFTMRLPSGLETESVILPIIGSTGRIRHTLCVSSQIGCAMGCRFCETAQMGLMQNLSAAEIIEQVLAARFEFRAPIQNIVFMGMGEPMHNLDAVLNAIKVMTDRNGLAIAPAGISVSTVGIAEGIVRLAQLARSPGFGKIRLAVSLNAPNDDIRSRIMPINRATPMRPLMEAMLEWPTQSGRNGGGRQRVFIEYVLIPGVNDATEHADELCAYLAPLRCTVNVIPYNPRRDSPWPAPDESSIRAFVQRVHERGQFVKRRQTFGRSVMAACGQLGNEHIRSRCFQPLSVNGAARSSSVIGC